MEFKDRLKKLRQEKQISQQELANAIYVSRSAVAKWENGLGLPNQTSYEALLNYFKITIEAFPLNEEVENISISKNQKIRNLSTIVISLLLIIVVVFSWGLYNAFLNGYGFTSKMAVGKIWQDKKYIHTPEYDFYYDTFGDENDLQVINSFCAVKKKWIGYQKLELEGITKTIYAKNGETFGTLYSFKGENKYYHFFRSVYLMGPETSGVHINLLYTIQIKEELIFVLHNSYFETNYAVTEFYVNDKLYAVL